MVRPVPYVGVTGIYTGEVVRKLLKQKPSYIESLLKIGVLVSSNSSVRFPLRYPKEEAIKNIFQESKDVLNIIHLHMNNQSGLLYRLEELTQIAGENLHGFQLNMVWPNPRVIKSYLVKHPEKKIILQVNSKLLNLVNFDPVLLAEKLKNRYEEIINYVLFDQSMGNGKQLDSKVTISYLKEIAKELPCVGLVVAGGLYANNLHLIYEISNLFPDISIDAEGKLRDPEYDHLDVFKAEMYVRKGFEYLDPKRNIL